MWIITQNGCYLYFILGIFVLNPRKQIHGKNQKQNGTLESLREMDKEKESDRDRQADRQTGRQTDRQTGKHAHTAIDRQRVKPNKTP